MHGKFHQDGGEILIWSHCHLCPSILDRLGAKSIACRGRFWWDPWWFPLSLGRIRRRLQGRSIISESLGPKSSWSWDLLTLVAKEGVFVMNFCKCISFQQGALKWYLSYISGVFFRTQLTLPYPLKNRGLHVCFCLLCGTSRFVDFVSLRHSSMLQLLQIRKDPWKFWRSVWTKGNW